MKSKDWIILVAVVIVVTFVVSLVIVNLTGNAIFLNYTRLVKANSCNADSICEISTAQASKAIISGGISTEFIDIKSIRAQATDVDTITLSGKFIANDLISRNSIATNFLKAQNISTYTL